jgi:ankyrin repeat protein
MLFRKYPILHTVIWKGNKKAALALIAGGANVKLADRDGNTPLHAAGHACASEIVRALLKKGADPKVRNNQRELPKM